VLALIYLQAWSVLLCTHIYINDAAGLCTAYGVKGCVSNTACVMIVTHVVMCFYANSCCVLMDANWVSDKKDCWSISGYCFYFLNSLVLWSAVKQKSVLLSSTESEYYAMTHAMKEALWIHLFLIIHQFPIPHPFPSLCNNQSTLTLVQSEAILSHSKHIDVCYHFICDHISDGSFSTTWIPTSNMTANILTKPLLSSLFLQHCCSLGLISSCFPFFVTFSLLSWWGCVSIIVPPLLYQYIWSCDHSTQYIHPSLLFPLSSIVISTIPDTEAVLHI